MTNLKSFESELYTANDSRFNNIALELFHFQAKNNPVYASYLKHLAVNAEEITAVESIPFLPVSFFKTQILKTGDWQPETTFLSSSTTGMVAAKHFVKNLSFYLDHAKHCFEFFFGPVSGYHFLTLLPSYFERGNSSLIAMIDFFIKESGSPYSGFYLSDFNQLVSALEMARKDPSKKTILWGVSFALLDLADHVRPDLSSCLVFETGGMKGRRREITRQELHATLKEAFNISTVYSEYGMTELFTQAYTRGGPYFHNTPWMKVLIREIGDPFTILPRGKAGGINVIDLANVHSVAFIETEDIGVLYPDGSFEVQGRLDNSDLRGCNLLME